MRVVAARRTQGREPDREPGTREAILDVAERLVQQRGFNAFSYADVAAELGITKPALHYHFAGKGELGAALITRYVERFAAALLRIDTDEGDAPAKLRAYVELYATVLREDRMCLCGMLAAEYRTLPEPMQAAVRTFFDENEAWLVGVLEPGRQQGSVSFEGSAREAASSIIDTLEGAMLVARPYGDVSRFERTAEHLLGELRGHERAATRRQQTVAST